MSNLVPKQHGQNAISVEQTDILRKTLFKGFNDEEVKFSMAVCNRTGLDPFTRQIHFNKRKNRKSGEETIVITTGIDGFRLIADRSQGYAGSDEPQFKLFEKHPVEATATVYKMVQGQRCPFKATVRWDEFYPGDNAEGFMWRRMPFQMLGKCAEAQALRKAFPLELSGIYIGEEMHQAKNEREIVQTKARELTAAVHETTESPDFIAAEFFEADDPVPAEESGLGGFTIEIGKKFKGKKLKDIKRSELSSYCDWLKDQKSTHADVLNCVENITKFLAEADDERV